MKIKKIMFLFFAAAVISMLSVNSAVACAGSSIVGYGPDGSYAVANCYTPPSIKVPEEEIVSSKTQESLSDMVDNNLISIMNRDVDLNPAKYSQADKLSSIEKIAYNNSKYDLSNIIDNRSSSGITANNSQYRHSMIKSAYNNDVQPKDSAVRADKIAKDNNGDIMISSSYDKSIKVSSYSNNGGEIKQL